MTLFMIPQVRTTMEDRVMIFLYFSPIWSQHSDKKCGRVFFKVGVAGAVH